MLKDMSSAMGKAHHTLFTFPVMESRYAYIDDICILPDFRHMGVGKALYDALAERIRPMGIRKVELKVWAFNESAMGFYEALGMKPQNIIMEGHI